MSALLSPSRGGGPGDGPAAIQLGFAAEPIVNLSDADATALYSECLARVRLAESVVLKPCAFVGSLEAQGEIGALDIAMLDLVLDTLANVPNIYLGCNISPKTLADAGAWRTFFERIERHAWLAERLTIEITESCPLNQIPGVAKHLMEAKRLGCRLAIDDFGAGFANPAHLQAVDVDWDIVKLDRSCLGDLRKTPSGRDGLRSFVGLAKCFAPLVVVEGIETPDHLLAALTAGAQYGQGWLFEGAMPKRWVVPDVTIREPLAALLVNRPGLYQPQGYYRTVGKDRRFILSPSDKIGDRVRAFVARARARMER